ncbi:MAG: hypothetical protein ACLTBV_25340 [Enterocloster bolteae]
MSLWFVPMIPAGVKTWDEITGAAKTVDKQSMESSFDMLEENGTTWTWPIRSWEWSLRI